MARSRASVNRADEMDAGVLCIDPDPDGGTWVLLDAEGNVQDLGFQDDIERVCEIADPIHDVVVEGVQGYGMPVGASVFETVKNIGHLRGYLDATGTPGIFDDTLTRPQIKSALCHKANATDANVNAALYDLYGDGTRSSCVGRKDAPGPLYGFKKDLWAALALGVVWLGKRGLGPLAARDGLRESELVEVRE